MERPFLGKLHGLLHLMSWVVSVAPVSSRLASPSAVLFRLETRDREGAPFSQRDRWQ
jgi:hypothetical protein